MNKPKTIILSAELSTLQPNENDTRTLNLMDTFRASEIAFKRVTGVYKGIKEVSFVVVPKNDNDERLIMSIANHFHQECVLSLDKLRNASLVFPDGKTQKIGRFVNVAEKIATKFDNYTIDGNNFFVVL